MSGAFSHLRPVENLVRLLGAKRSGDRWIAKCPARDDHEPSLSIAEGADDSAAVYSWGVGIGLKLKCSQPLIASTGEKLSEQKKARTSDANSRPVWLGQSLADSDRKARSTAEAGSQKGRFYKPLPKKFRRDGFQYRQIAREGDAAIYEQTWDECCNPSVSYEVVRIRRRDGFWIDDRFVEPAEVYPNSEAWGTDGFTLIDKDAAFVKLRELA